VTAFQPRAARRALIILAMAMARQLPLPWPQHLPHSWATLALKVGEHPEVVAERFGQSSTAVTREVHSHVVEGNADPVN
jgi:integrase